LDTVHRKTVRNKSSIPTKRLHFAHVAALPFHPKKPCSCAESIGTRGASNTYAALTGTGGSRLAIVFVQCKVIRRCPRGRYVDFLREGSQCRDRYSPGVFAKPAWNAWAMWTGQGVGTGCRSGSVTRLACEIVSCLPIALIGHAAKDKAPDLSAR
jgi:hypothetical protein